MNGVNESKVQKKQNILNAKKVLANQEKLSMSIQNKHLFFVSIQSAKAFASAKFQ